MESQNNPHFWEVMFSLGISLHGAKTIIWRHRKRHPNLELNEVATILLTSQDAYWWGGLLGQILTAIEKKKNKKKTIILLFSTREMARVHNFSENGLKISDRDLERIIQSFLVWIYVNIGKDIYWIQILCIRLFKMWLFKNLKLTSK